VLKAAARRTGDWTEPARALFSPPFRFSDRLEAQDMLVESLFEREAERLEPASCTFRIFQAGQSLSS
jgi:hypothetical protein